MTVAPRPARNAPRARPVRNVQPPGYRWNPAARQYIRSDGRFVTRAEIASGLERVRAVQQGKMAGLSGQLQRGEITLAAWQTGMARELKLAHAVAAAAARGGWAHMAPADWLAVARATKFQYEKLAGFALDVERGKYDRPDGTLGGNFTRRSDMYGEAMRGTYEEMRRRLAKQGGELEERRVLGLADHCETCIEQAAIGWAGIGTLNRIGDSECHTRCRCHFEFRGGTEIAAAAAAQTSPTAPPTPPDTPPAKPPATPPALTPGQQAAVEHVLDRSAAAHAIAPPIAPPSSGVPIHPNAVDVLEEVHGMARAAAEALIAESERAMLHTIRTGNEASIMVGEQSGRVAGAMATGSRDGIGMMDMLDHLDELAAARGAGFPERFVHLHTHPLGSAFSPADLGFLANYEGIRTIVVRGTEGTLYVMTREGAAASVTRVAGAAPVSDQIERDWQVVGNRIQPYYQQKVNEGMDRNEAWREQTHEMMKELQVVKSGFFQYTRLKAKRKATA